MSNKYEVNAWIVVEGTSEDEAKDLVYDAISTAFQQRDGFLSWGTTSACPFYDEGEAPYCEDCEE